MGHNGINKPTAGQRRDILFLRFRNAPMMDETKTVHSYAIPPIDSTITLYAKHKGFLINIAKRIFCASAIAVAKECTASPATMKAEYQPSHVRIPVATISTVKTMGVSTLLLPLLLRK